MGEGLERDISWIKETLERIEGRMTCEADKCRDRHHILDIEIAALTVRSGIIAAVAGILPAVLTIIVIIYKLK